MKPAGRERDKEIAKLKGWSEEVIPPDYWHCDSKIALKREDGDLLCPDCCLTSWSTIRNDSWELWDELPYIKQFTMWETNKGCVISIYKSLGNYSKRKLFLHSDGKDFPDAVSQAWTKWMESK